MPNGTFSYNLFAETLKLKKQEIKVKIKWIFFHNSLIIEFWSKGILGYNDLRPL